MCFKSSAQDKDRSATRREEDRRRPYPNHRPRGNGETDRRDLKRSVERLEQVLGR